MSADAKLLKAMMQKPEYEALLRLSASLIDRWQSHLVKADTEFQTLWNTCERESKVAAIKEFLDSLERQAFDA